MRILHTPHPPPQHPYRIGPQPARIIAPSTA
jgi:hypothetical protein